MTVKEQIEQKLNAAFEGAEIEVIDESHKHAGHSGARPEGETHFHVNIKAEAFAGKTRVAQQKLVYAALDDLMNNPIHALSMTVGG